MPLRPGFFTKLISTTLILLGLAVIFEVHEAMSMIVRPPGYVPAPGQKPDPAQPQSVKLASDVEQDYSISIRLNIRYGVPSVEHPGLYESAQRDSIVYENIDLGRFSGKTIQTLSKEIVLTRDQIQAALEKGKDPKQHHIIDYSIDVTLRVSAGLGQPAGSFTAFRFTVGADQVREQAERGRLTLKFSSDGQDITAQYKVSPAATQK